MTAGPTTGSATGRMFSRKIPNLLKPNLNNTGPFRYWILESLRDNKPLDRFATELITMRGSTWGGGAAGFSVASQNDVPMAAKAHIIGTAFPRGRHEMRPLSRRALS